MSNRKSPTGGSAYRMLKNWSRPAMELLPMKVPTVVCTVGAIASAVLLPAASNTSKAVRQVVSDSIAAVNVCRMCDQIGQ